MKLSSGQYHHATHQLHKGWFLHMISQNNERKISVVKTRFAATSYHKSKYFHADDMAFIWDT